MKKYKFILESHETELDENERPELFAWYPSRQACIEAARSFCNQSADLGLYIDWINEYDEDGNLTASIPFGDYERLDHTWPWPKEREKAFRVAITPELYISVATADYVWDEE